MNENMDSNDDEEEEEESSYEEEEEEDVTAVGAVPESAEATTSDETYNVAGQRVGKAYKGLVIRNGKKYSNK